MLLQLGKNICVFCASSNEVREEFKKEAKSLVHLLAKHNFNLVFGGCKVGLMGVVAMEMKKLNRKIIGILPKAIMDYGLVFEELDEMILTDSMYDRKKKMAEFSDAYIILPGGFGTLDELTEVLVQKSLEIEKKPIVILNTNHFYDILLNFFQKIVDENLANREFLKLYKVVDNINDAIEYLIQNIDKDTSITNVAKKW